MCKASRFGSVLAAWLLAVPTLSAPVLAQEPPKPANDDPSAMIRVEVRLDQTTVLAGQPVWATFTVSNVITDAVVLQVPGAQVAEMPATEAGLPLQHVFSGKHFAALSIEDDHGNTPGETVHLRPTAPIASVILASNGCVGIRVDLTRHYEILKRPGVFKIVWKPYAGAVQSEVTILTVLSKQRAKIVTDYGTISIEFHYDLAPNHVRNFVELARRQFYDNLTFHRVIPGAFIQGGDPKGDGRGVAEGRTLKAEFSKVPFDLGTVAMARLPQNPDSASCQFLIGLGRQPGLDGNQTVFGRVVGTDSLDTLKKIAALPTGAKERPLQRVYIRTISLENIIESPERGLPSSTGEVGPPKPSVARVRHPGEAKPNEPPPAATSAPAGSQPAEASAGR